MGIITKEYMRAQRIIGFILVMCIPVIVVILGLQFIYGFGSAILEKFTREKR